MGISNLNKFLLGKCPDVFKTIHLSDLQYMKGAVDVSLYVFKYKASFGDTWLSALFNLVMCLRRNNIHASFIYDTGAPVEKNEERQRRKEHKEKLESKIMELTLALDKAKLTGEIDPILIEFNNTLSEKQQQVKSLLRVEKEKSINLETLEYEISKKQRQLVTITSEDFEISRKLLDVTGIPWFNAPGEAETTCSDLCIRGKVDAVISEDTDVLCYGAPLVVTKIDVSKNTAVIVRHADILESLGLTADQFTDFCIMCGTDYNKNIFKVGPEKSFKLIKEYGNIDGITSLDTSILNHKRVREIFRNYEKIEVDVTYCKQPDVQKLYEFIQQRNVKTSLQTIKSVFSVVDFEIIE